MKKLIPFLAAFIAFGCNSADQAELLLEDVVGTYVGVMPCADCAGIDYRITLADDYSFEDRMDYIGKSSNALTVTGSFEIRDGRVILKKPTDSFSKLGKHPQGLIMLDNDGNRIEGGTADLYILRSVNEDALHSDASTAGSIAASDSVIKPRQDKTEVDEVSRARINRHIKSWEKDLNFHAYGTEPFWSLGIDFSRGMQFTTLDSQDIQTPMGVTTETDDGKSRKYAAETELGELIVELEHTECTDQMSGEKFEYTVTIMTKYSSDRSYRTYKGCGEYVLDPRLHNIWVVEEFKGEKIDHEAFKRGIPQIEINVRDNTYAGHDGCNSIRGKLSVEQEVARFEPGPTTLMACDDDGLSNDISLALTDMPYEYEIGSRLILTRNGETYFIFKKVD